MFWFEIEETDDEGLILIIKVAVSPAQPPGLTIAVIVDVVGVLLATKAGIVPVPDGASPMDGLLFVQEAEKEVFVLIGMALVVIPAQNDLSVALVIDAWG